MSFLVATMGGYEMVRSNNSRGETTLAAVSMHCSHDPAANWRKYQEFIDEAASRSVDFLVFPEVSLQGYFWGTRAIGSPVLLEQQKYFRSVAETIPGPTTDKLVDLAKKHSMYIQAGIAESTLDRKILYNSAVLVGPEGLVGVFRKFHNKFEWPIFSPGNEIPVFPTSLGKVGMFICYDLAFPEVTRVFALKGAAIATLTTAWPMKGEDPETDYYGYTYDILTRANAFANQMWMICSNQVRRPPTPGASNYFGHSRIVAPTGKVVADIGYDEGIVSATVDVLGDLERARNLDFFGHNLLRDRRPSYYEPISHNGFYTSPADSTDEVGDVFVSESDLVVT
jgi:predicted amidohydrolase